MARLCGTTFDNMGGRGERTKAPSKLQDLRRRIYVKAKANKTWRFWGLYVATLDACTEAQGFRLEQME